MTNTPDSRAHDAIIDSIRDDSPGFDAHQDNNDFRRAARELDEPSREELAVALGDMLDLCCSATCDRARALLDRMVAK